MTYQWVYDFVYWQFVVSDLSMTYKWVYDFVYWQSVVRLTYKWVYDFVYWQSVVRLTYISGSMTLYTGSLLSVISG
jgi:hypothetical protein